MKALLWTLSPRKTNNLTSQIPGGDSARDFSHPKAPLLKGGWIIADFRQLDWGSSPAIPRFYNAINLAAHFIKMFIYVQIAKADHFHALISKRSCSFLILLQCFRTIMSSAVEFYRQFCSGTIKIYNILTNCLLALKTNRVLGQKAIP